MAPNAGRRLLPEGTEASDSPVLDEESGWSTAPGRDDFYAMHKCKIFSGSLVLLFLSAAIFVASLIVGRSDDAEAAAPVLTNELNTPMVLAELPNAQETDEAEAAAPALTNELETPTVSAELTSTLAPSVRPQCYCHHSRRGRVLIFFFHTQSSVEQSDPFEFTSIISSLPSSLPPTVSGICAASLAYQLNR